MLHGVRSNKEFNELDICVCHHPVGVIFVYEASVSTVFGLSDIMPDLPPVLLHIPFPPPLQLTGNLVDSMLDKHPVEQRAAKLITCMG